MHDIGYDRITIDDLNRPTAAKMIPIYAFFLEQTLDLTLDDVLVTAQLHLDSMADPVRRRRGETAEMRAGDLSRDGSHRHTLAHHVRSHRRRLD